MRTVIIIPTFNERENINQLLDVVTENIRRLPLKFDTHILVVDDSSPDGTAEEVQKKLKKYSHVHLLINPCKVGLGSAYLKGMEYAVSKLKAEVLMEFDADFSHDPQKIPAFLTKIDAGYDMVLGSRYIKGGTIPANWGIHRKFLSFFGNWLIRIVMTNFRIHDWTTGYRAIRKEVYEAVKDDLNQDRFFGYTFQIGFLHKAVRKGFKITEEPIHFIDRTRGESKLGTEYIKNTLLYIFKARWLELTSWRFFKFAVVGGTGFLLQTLIFEVVGVWGKLTTPTVATVIGGQAAIISNFLINNVWTFRDKTISEPLAVAVKFGQFWLTSNLAVVVIQGGSVRVGEGLVGPGHLLIQGFYLSGIFLTLIWNYTIYNRFIWRTDKY